jgi:hypothetical protein
MSWGFLVAGFLVPFILEGLFYAGMDPIEWMPEWLFIALWPAFGFVMASDTGSGVDKGRALFGFVMSVLANDLLYLLAGCLISLIHRKLFSTGQQPHV